MRNQGLLRGTGVIVCLVATTARAQTPAEPTPAPAIAEPQQAPASTVVTPALEPAPAVAPAQPAEPTQAAAQSAPEAPPAPAAPPPPPTVFHTPEGWPVYVSPTSTQTILFYGFAEVDMMHDTTQSFPNDGSNNGSVARPGTVAGDNGQTQFTARNSRLGIKIESPTYYDMKALAQAEIDFYGNQPSTSSEGSLYTNAPPRMRHYFLTLKTPVVDVIAGQYHDLFGWGGNGFYPNTVAFLGLPGEVYHRNPQIRLSKTIKSEALNVEVAAAAVRPVGRASEVPDGQAGVRLVFNQWNGVRAQGSGPPDAGPMAIGISGVARRFRVNPFSTAIGDYKTATGWGLAGDVVIPIIRCTNEDMRNAVTLTGEATVGSGISDLYSGLTGGARYPALPNPTSLNPAPVYVSNLDQGIVAFDDRGAQADIHPINWRGLVAGVQYHLPFWMGKKIWVSGVYSMIQSTNLEKYTPDASKSTIWTKGQYFDGNVFVAITPSVQVDLSYQVTKETYADIDPTTGSRTKATNDRAEFAAHYFC